MIEGSQDVGVETGKKDGVRTVVKDYKAIQQGNASIGPALFMLRPGRHGFKLQGTGQTVKFVVPFFGSSGDR
jgi:hypothetical protein